MGTNTATVELTSVKKREKTKQRQNENSTLCCSNICCSCPVTKSFTNTNKFFNKSTNNYIKGNLYNKSTNNSIKGNLYNKSTNNCIKSNLYNKSTNNCIKGNLYNKSTNNSIKGNIYNRIKQTANNNKQPTSNNLWSIFIWSSCNFFSIYQFYG